ncbi:MAG: hypothetical protein KJ674_01755 [Nanoarchaeota archaeon]|nr:hypothetical protein [Nanoarchaeota archaeon]
MNIKCPKCGSVCQSLIDQKILSKNCDIKSYFNIIQVKCGCGNTTLLNITPKSIKIFGENRKLVRFH